MTLSFVRPFAYIREVIFEMEYFYNYPARKLGCDCFSCIWLKLFIFESETCFVQYWIFSIFWIFRLKSDSNYLRIVDVSSLLPNNFTLQVMIRIFKTTMQQLILRNGDVITTVADFNSPYWLQDWMRTNKYENVC